MDSPSLQNSRNLVRWVRERNVWSHVHVSGIAIKLDGDWVCLWARAILADASMPESPLGKPVIETEGVLAFRVAARVSVLAQLLCDVRCGTIPAGRLKYLRVPIRMRCGPARKSLGYISFDNRLATTFSGVEGSGPERWPRIESECQGGQISEWAGDDRTKYERLSRIEQLFKSSGFGTIAELGTKLGFHHHSSDFVHSTSKYALSAPLLARVASAQHDRGRNVILATIEVGTRVRRGMLQLRLVESTGAPPRNPMRIPTGKERLVTMEIPGPAEGRVEVSLSHRDIGEISSRTVTVLPPFRPWLRLSAISLIDPGLSRIRLDLASKTAETHERGVSMLLGLLGYASFWWTPKLPQPVGSANGQHAQDVMAFSSSDDQCLVVECKTGWTKDSKINTLVGRANSMTDRLSAYSVGDVRSTRALLAVSCPRLETPNAIKENLRLNGAGLLALEDATDLLDMMAKGVPESEVHARFEKAFVFDELAEIEFPRF